jgi:hypothetical protein
MNENKAYYSDIDNFIWNFSIKSSTAREKYGFIHQLLAVCSKGYIWQQVISIITLSSWKW